MTNADHAGGVVAYALRTESGALADPFILPKGWATPDHAETNLVPLVEQSLLIEAQAEVADANDALVKEADRAERAEADAENLMTIVLLAIKEFPPETAAKWQAEINKAAIDKARGGRE